MTKKVFFVVLAIALITTLFTGMMVFAEEITRTLTSNPVFTNGVDEGYTGIAYTSQGAGSTTVADGYSGYYEDGVTPLSLPAAGSTLSRSSINYGGVAESNLYLRLDGSGSGSYNTYFYSKFDLRSIQDNVKTALLLPALKVSEFIAPDLGIASSTVNSYPVYIDVWQVPETKWITGFGAIDTSPFVTVGGQVRAKNNFSYNASNIIGPLTNTVAPDKSLALNSQYVTDDTVQRIATIKIPTGSQSIYTQYQADISKYIADRKANGFDTATVRFSIRSYMYGGVSTPKSSFKILFQRDTNPISLEVVDSTDPTVLSNNTQLGYITLNSGENERIIKTVNFDQEPLDQNIYIADSDLTSGNLILNTFASDGLAQISVNGSAQTIGEKLAVQITPSNNMATAQVAVTAQNGQTATYNLNFIVTDLDEYDRIRLKKYVEITGGESVDFSDTDVASKVQGITSTAQSNWSSMNTSSGRTYLFSGLTFSDPTDSSDVSNTYGKITTMALAYSTVGSTLNGNQSLKADIINAMDWMYSNKYNENIAEYDNWWDWEIGAAGAINNIVTMMYNDLTQEQIANYMSAEEYYCPDSRAQYKDGANRVWYCESVAMRGILTKDFDAIAAARDGLSDTFLYVTSGDGFYRDGSFIHHDNFAYNGGYGLNMVDDLPSLIMLLKGTTWRVTDPESQNVYQWVYDGYEPLIYKGSLMDMVRGREISRYTSRDYDAAARALGGILGLIDVAPSADAAYFKSMVKQLILDDTNEYFYEDATISQITKAKVIMSDASIASRGTLNKYKLYAAIDRAVIQRPNYAFGISMHSTRNKNYESINGENLKGWHTGDGMTYLYTQDTTHFSDNFWPTVYSCRMPGTTVEQSTTASQGLLSTSDWVGGTDMDDTYGIAGMLLHPNGFNLEAKKSWFMFDNEIVCLGAGITASDGKKVESIVENRKLTDANTDVLTVNGTVKPNTLGWAETMSNVSWAHLSGPGVGSGIGYYFPNSPNIRGLREARSGAWRDINTGGSTANISKKYMTLWFDHLVDPTNKSYSYVLLPEKSATEVQSYAANPEITVLANNGNVQAALDSGLDIMGANFWTDTAQSVSAYGKANYLASDKKASVMVQNTDNEIKVSVSDPTQSNTSTIQITLDETATSVITKDSRITLVSLSPTVVLNVDVNGAAGSAIKINLSK